MPRGNDAVARIKTAMGLGCGELDKIDRTRLPSGWDGGLPGPDGKFSIVMPDDIVAMDQATHERLQEGPVATPSSAADAEIRLAQHSRGYIPPRTALSLVARREAGFWTIYAVTETSRPEIPDPMVDSPWIASLERSPTKRLTPDDAATLDRILADKCLWSAPTFMPQAIPIRKGGIYMCPPHGPDTTFDIRDGTRRWRGAQFCRTVGPQRDLERLLIKIATGYPGDGLNPMLFRTGPSEEDPYGDMRRAAKPSKP